jgi:hypothetical protein
MRWHDSRKEVPPPGRAVVTRDETGAHDIALIDHGGLWHFGTIPVPVTTQARQGVSVSWAYFTNFRPTKRRWPA